MLLAGGSAATAGAGHQPGSSDIAGARLFSGRPQSDVARVGFSRAGAGVRRSGISWLKQSMLFLIIAAVLAVGIGGAPGVHGTLSSNSNSMTTTGHSDEVPTAIRLP